MRHVFSWFRVVDAVIVSQHLTKRVDVRLVYKLEFPYRYREFSHQTSRNMPPKGKRKARQETPDRDDGRVSPPPVKRSNAASGPSSSSAAASFFTPLSQKAPPIEFVKHGSLLAASWEPGVSSKTTTATHIHKSVTASGSKTTASSIVTTETSTGPSEPMKDGKVKFAGFDLDSNLISTKSGNKFGKDGEDWKWWHPTVPSKLRQMFDDGYRLVIFTNQNGLKASGSKADEKLKEWKKKINYIVTALSLPIHVYAATETDIYRKPRTGMFEHYLSELGEDAAFIDMDSSVFVGDAAGRKGDFSAGDRKFAENLGIKFLTPEELFLDEKPMPYEFDLDPVSFPRSALGPDFEKKYPLELVVLCGRPGAGKSTLTTKYLEPLGYERINQDILKTRDKCVKAAEGHLKEGQSVVIDATNSAKDVRAVWKALADKVKGVTFRCIYLTTSEVVCYHNDGVRAYSGISSLNPEKRTSVGSMAFKTFKSKFQEPDLGEGFKDITVVDFEFRGTDAEFDVWKRHWAP
ncbi:hypothetical protein TWF730_003474 [Orbilia blumenaviensis]|uniref:Uncharacterized protein n=1 Tax=Orbilia blumenaviensis TaxID=1796055 RepID=A0AAV9U2J7_9PEZI